MNLLDLIFPKYCVNCKKYGDFVCSDCFSRLSMDTKNICLPCGKPTFNSLTHPMCLTKNTINGVFTGVVFSQISRKLVYQFKYRPNLYSLSSFMADLLYESIIQQEEFNKILNSKFILIPIPLSAKKLRKRGYNQAELLAKELSKKLGFEMLDLLLRIKETPTQVGLNKVQRKENMKGAFEIKNKFLDQVKNKNIILIDDVLTTGATISEANYTLKKYGAGKIYGVAFAREQ